MRYGKKTNLDLKLMRMMKPLRKIVIYDITQTEFCIRLGTNSCLRAAATQIVGTQAPIPCERCKKRTWPFRECVRVLNMSRGCCGNYLWSKDPVHACSFINGTYQMQRVSYDI
ncbi:unnamed protein product [Penicillium nalgiovense]|nr:unnamed protein product [Penicillium nalgiovense]